MSVNDFCLIPEKHDIYQWIRKFKKKDQLWCKWFGPKYKLNLLFENWIIYHSIIWWFRRIVFWCRWFAYIRRSWQTESCWQKVTNSTILTNDIIEIEEEIKEAINIDTDPIELSSSNSSKDQNTFEETESITKIVSLDFCKF